MAEIRVERKESGPWAWLIPLLLVGAALWWFFGRGPDGAVATSRETADSAAAYNGAQTPSTDSAASGAADFSTFVAAQNAGRDENQQHAYTAGGIRRLAAALDGMQPGAGTSTRLADMREQANALESSSVESNKHADMARAAFIAAADVFGGLPEDRVSKDAASQVRAAAEALKPSATLLEQKERIDTFFAAASQALRSAKS